MTSLNNEQHFFGYAVCDKENNSRELKVYSTDLLPLHSGAIKATEATVAIKTKSGSGANDYQGEVCESNYITCTYRDDSSNHTMNPPDVRAGEQVEIYKLADNEQQYYWKPCARTEGNRRTETHRIAISDTCSNDAELGNDNSYYIQMDTRRSHSIVISTNQGDGEAFKYKLSIDADKNQIYLGDDKGTGVLIDSNTPSVTIRNSTGSTIQVTDGNMDMTCNGSQNVYIKGDISQTVDGDISLTCEGNVRLRCKGDVTVISNGAITLKSNTAINLSAPVVNVSKGGVDPWEEA
jgi:hypothetical protein